MVAVLSFATRAKRLIRLVIGKNWACELCSWGALCSVAMILISTELVDVAITSKFGVNVPAEGLRPDVAQRDIAGQIANNLRLKISGEEHIA